MDTLELSAFFHCMQVTVGCDQAYSEVIDQDDFECDMLK